MVDHGQFVSPHQMTPLHWAAKKGCVDTVQYLVWIGANINIKADEGVSE